VTLFETLLSPYQTRPRLALRGGAAGAKGYLLARCFDEQRVPLLIVTPDARQRDALTTDLRFFLAGFSPTSLPPSGGEDRVCPYIHPPANTAQPYASAQHRALHILQPLWRLWSGEPVIVIAAVESLRYGVTPPADLQQCLFPMRSGGFFALSDVVAALIDRGYRRVPLVESIGEFSVRGGILDLFSPGQPYPWRLEFFGDELETIRTVEVQTQTSLATLQEVLIAPMHVLGRQSYEAAGFTQLQAYLQAQGWSPSLIAAAIERWSQQSPALWPWGVETFFYETVQSPLTYLPPTGLLCCVDVEEVQIRLQHLSPPAPIQIGEATASLPSDALIAPEDIEQALQERADITFFLYDPPAPVTPVTMLHARAAPQFFGVLDHLVTQLRRWQAEGWCTLILCRFPLEVRRMQELLAAYDLGSRPLAAGVDCLSETMVSSASIVLGVGEVSQGFILPEMRLVVLREVDIFGEKKHDVQEPVRPQRAQLDFGTLQAGDRVVHTDYGIGRYRRMTFLDVGMDGGEFIELEYAEGATLYVPSHRLSMVQKYIGGEGDGAPLDRLGGSAWTRTKERVRESLLAMAASLVTVHARRQAEVGYAFSPAAAMHHEFASRFEYAETEDQLRAIDDVMADMERTRPMDRLVCGDVGYGKTEVAMRAAFKAIYDGKQAAILVPTTVLAQQHYDTLQRRFAAYPVEIAVLSRMRSRKEQQQVLAGLRSGSIDIVIGTHRLLQPDVQFKDLGLLVVDEEHRFGVAHKERIKQLSTQIDVLVLTATPIPRSLHMTLVGLRDFSLIETPPEGRSAIQTIVAPYAEETIRQAIQDELGRGGQVFFVYNRIDVLPAVRAMLSRLVPECRVGIAHGQMREHELEKMMLQFLRREFDLLLCTTIIESGLDIPSVNTIIIHHAEQFGLAQLYQLRGRVGRGTQQAYAYLLIPGDLLLSDVARKRIEAIEEFSALGSGFQLAARDLEIRGAGNLLGAQQSGHIASVGFDLYCQMLAEAISTIRDEPVPVRVDPELRLEVQGYIPPTYVESEAQRLELYRRLATVATDAELDRLRQELADRFGPVPEPVQRVLAVVECKILARQLTLERIEQQRRAVLLSFHPQTSVDSTVLLEWLQFTGLDFRFQSEHVVRIPLDGDTPQARLARLKTHLQQLGARAHLP
jgi:transcription-repair coupling factor (superfamily II helicase)